jgi:hypothetical protein
MERVGFEPTIPCGIPAFQTGAFGHSATSPNKELKTTDKQSKSRGGGIRTPGTRERTLDFESSAFSHSATPPERFDGA